MAKYNSLVNKLHLNSCVCKRCRDDVFVLWEHGAASLSPFFRLFEYYRFSYTTPNTCYPKSNICNISTGIALRLKIIWDDDGETFGKRSSKNQNCLFARDHTPSIVKEQFSKAKKETRSEVRQKQTKQDKMSVLNLLIPITLHGLTFTISSKIMDLYYTLIKI